MQTTLVTFRIYHPEAYKIELFGSWNAFSKPYQMERDSRRGHGEFVGIFDFKHVIYDGPNSKMNGGTTLERSNGLLQGGTYHYYYNVNGITEYFDPAKPTTTACPLLPGQVMNVYEVPEEKSPGTCSTVAADQPQSCWTLDPRDRFVTPKPSATGTMPSDTKKSPRSPREVTDMLGSRKSESPTSPHRFEDQGKPRRSKASSIRSFIRSTFKVGDIVSKHVSSDNRAQRMSDRPSISEPVPAVGSMGVEIPRAPLTAVKYEVSVAPPSQTQSNFTDMSNGVCAKAMASSKQGGSVTNNTQITPNSRQNTSFWSNATMENVDIKIDGKSSEARTPSRKKDSIHSDDDLYISEHHHQPREVQPHQRQHMDRSNSGLTIIHSRGPSKDSVDTMLQSQYPEVAFQEVFQTTAQANDAPSHGRKLSVLAPLPILDELSNPTSRPTLPQRPTLVRSAFSAWTDTTASTNNSESASPIATRSRSTSIRQSALSNTTVRPEIRKGLSFYTDSTSFGSPSPVEDHQFVSPMICSPHIDENWPLSDGMLEGTPATSSFESPLFSFPNSGSASPGFSLPEPRFGGDLQGASSLVNGLVFASPTTEELGQGASIDNQPSSVPSAQTSHQSSRFITPVFVERSRKRMGQYAGVRDKPMPTMMEPTKGSSDYFSCKNEEPGDYFSCKNDIEPIQRPGNEAIEEERKLEELKRSVSELMRLVNPQYFESRSSSGPRTPDNVDIAEEFSYLGMVVA